MAAVAAAAVVAVVAAVMAAVVAAAVMAAADRLLLHRSALMRAPRAAFSQKTKTIKLVNNNT